MVLQFKNLRPVALLAGAIFSLLFFSHPLEANQTGVKEPTVVVTAELLAARAEADRRVRVYLENLDKGWAPPKGFSVSSAYGPLLLLESVVPVTESQLKELRRYPGVAAASRDVVILRPKERSHDQGTSTASEGRPQAKEECKLSDRCANGQPRFWGQKLMMVDLMHGFMDAWGVPKDVTSKVSVVDSGFDKTQEDRFDSVGGVKTHRGVLVGEEHPYKKYSKVSHYKKDEEIIGDPEVDPNGHGTMVSSTIAGKDGLGVGKSVDLSVYRVTKGGNTGSTSGAWLEMSLLRACDENRDPDGLSVINVSWGGRLDESNLDPNEEDEVMQKVIEHVTAKGCLVVKSSGNSNFRAPRNADALDDAYLRVAATDSSLGLASFSTVGEVGAPGESIYVNRSSQERGSIRKEKQCGAEKDRQFVNGTSFASPFVAGIASQVIRSLKHGGKFKELAPGERIRLVNRILRASMHVGVVNGLRAVAIAGIWSKKLEKDERQSAVEGKPMEGVARLKNLLAEHPVKACEKEVNLCQKIRECNAKKNCIRSSQVRLALCVPPNQDELEDVAQSAYDLDGFELGHYYSRMGESAFEDPKRAQKLRRMAVNSYLKKEGYYDVKKPVSRSRYHYTPYSQTPEYKRQKIFREMPINFMANTLAPYLEKFVEEHRSTSKSIMEQVVKGTLSSYDVKSALELGFDPKTGEDRGSTFVLDAVDSILQSGKKAIGRESFQKTISNMIDEYERNVDYSSESDSYFDWDHATPYVRILDRLIRKEAPATPMHDFLLSQEARVIKNMRRLNEFYGKETQGFVSVIETYPDRHTLQPMLERHLEQTIKDAKEHGVDHLSSVELHHLIQKEGASRPLGSRKDFLMGVLELVAQGRGWKGKNDKEVVESILGELLTLKDTFPAEEWKALEDRFVEIVAQSTNPDFVALFLNGYWKDEVFGVRAIEVLLKVKSDEELRAKGLSYRAHPLLSKRVMALLSRKSAATLISADPALVKDIKLRFDLQSGFSHAWKGLGGLEDLDPDMEIVAPILKKEQLTRLTNRDELPEFKTMKLSEAGFSEYVLGAIRLAEDRNSAEFAGKVLEGLELPYSVRYQGYYGRRDEKTIELQKILEALPATGPWRTKADAFLKDGEGYRTHMARYHMKNFLVRLDQFNQEEIQAYKKEQADKGLKAIKDAVAPVAASVWKWINYLPKPEKPEEEPEK